MKLVDYCFINAVKDSNWRGYWTRENTSATRGWNIKNASKHGNLLQDTRGTRSIESKKWGKGCYHKEQRTEYLISIHSSYAVNPTWLCLNVKLVITYLNKQLNDLQLRPEKTVASTPPWFSTPNEANGGGPKTPNVPMSTIRGSPLQIGQATDNR